MPHSAPTADPVDVAVWRYLAHDGRVTDKRKRDYARGRLDALDDARVDTTALELRLDQRKDLDMPVSTTDPAQAHIAHLRRLELAHMPKAERETLAKRLDSHEELDPAAAAIAAYRRMETGH